MRIINFHAAHNSHQNMKQKLIEMKRNSCTIIFGRHQYPTLNNRTTRKINKETENLNNTTNQQNLTVIY